MSRTRGIVSAVLGPDNIVFPAAFQRRNAVHDRRQKTELTTRKEYEGTK